MIVDFIAECTWSMTPAIGPTADGNRGDDTLTTDTIEETGPIWTLYVDGASNFGHHRPTKLTYQVVFHDVNEESNEILRLSDRSFRSAVLRRIKLDSNKKSNETLRLSYRASRSIVLRGVKQDSLIKLIRLRHLQLNPPTDRSSQADCN